MPKLSTKTSRSKGSKCYVMQGGPLNNQKLWLSSPGTLAFKLNGKHGFYNHSNIWHDLN